MAKPTSKSFYDWCIENNHEDWLELWDYELNGCSPKDVGYGENKKKYYFKCPRGIHKSELKKLNDLTRPNRNLKCNQCSSFGQWCIDNSHEDWLDLWDYELNNCSPFDIGYSSKNKYYFKCPKGIHNSELKALGNITKNSCLRCDQCNSFGQYLLDEFGENALELYWDYELNKVNPFEIAKNSITMVFIKCQNKKYHPSYELRCSSFYYGYRCPYCSHKSSKVHPKDSFGQLLINEHGTIDGIWDYEKNGDLNPFELCPQSNKKVWLICQKTNHHGSYEISCSHYYNGKRCSYCAMRKIHPKDSFGQKLINDYGEDAIERYWSIKNTIDPFSIAPNSKTKVWIKCKNDKGHEDYEITCNNFTHGRRCPECKESYGEREIKKYLILNEIAFIPQKEFLDLVGVSEWKPLPYDFYLPEYNLLIEYQGEFHDGTAYQQTEEDYLIRQEHDKRKREYAKLHNIRLLEIWYWDFDNIIEILNKELGLS